MGAGTEKNLRWGAPAWFNLAAFFVVLSSVVMLVLTFKRFVFRMNGNLRDDYGDQYIYETANAQLPPSPHRVVLFGDSITYLWGQSDPAFFARHPNWVNRGIAGQATRNMMVRFRQDVIELHPETVHVLAGVNDLRGMMGPTPPRQIEENVMTMVELAQLHHIRVVIGSVLPARKVRGGKVEQVNAWLRRYAAEQGITYVDYYDALQDGQNQFRKELTFDGEHPTREGFKVMEPLAEKAVASAPPAPVKAAAPVEPDPR